MTRKRDYIEEIIAKKERLLKHTDRKAQFDKRIHPLVKGFRFVKTLDASEPFREELLKYYPIGYIACVEGYFRLLLAELIDSGPPYSDNVTSFKDIKFSIHDVLAIHRRKVTLGEFVAHLLPIRNVSDINFSMSTILNQDFLALLKSKSASQYNPTPLGELFPGMIGYVEEAFKLRHLYAHELATKEPVDVEKIEQCVGMTALFTVSTEELMEDILSSNS